MRRCSQCNQPMNTGVVGNKPCYACYPCGEIVEQEEPVMAAFSAKRAKPLEFVRDSDPVDGVTIGEAVEAFRKSVGVIAMPPGTKFEIHCIDDQLWPLEADFVNYAKEQAKLYGYEILWVSQRGGFGSGTTKGCPDSFWSHPLWPDRDRHKAIELKGEDTKVTEEQQKLADEGYSTICRTMNEVWRALGRIR